MIALGLLAVASGTAVIIVACCLVGSALVVKVGMSLLLRYFERTADTPEEAAGYQDLRENPPPTKILPDKDDPGGGGATYPPTL